MALIDNSGNKQSSVLPVPNNIETEAQIEHPNIEVDDQSAVLPVANNIETEAQVEHLKLEVELQTSEPWSANYIETKTDGGRSLSDCYRELREHFAQNYDRAKESKELVVAALLHDIGDDLAPYNHSELAAIILKPYVSEKTYWIIKHHGIFQLY